MTPLSPNRPLWDELPPLPTTPLAGETEADLCVVGLGGTGLTCLAEALALGASRVIGIDAGPIAGGAAGRNGGFLLAGTADFHHDAVQLLGRERAVAIYRRSLEEMERFAHEGESVARFPGSLRIAGSDEEYEDCRRQLAQMYEDGLPVESYVGPEGKGLLIPTDGVFHPMRRCHALARRLLDAGARLHSETEALELHADRVVTARGTIRARHVIVCVDGRLEALFPELGSEVRTARLQMLGTAPLNERRFTRPVYRRYGFDYWQQLPDGRITLGGGRDQSVETEWTSDATPSATLQRYLTETLRHTLGVEVEVTHRWAASVSYTQHGLPVFREIRGIRVIGAYSGTGNIIGALCGRAAAQRARRAHSDLASLFER